MEILSDIEKRNRKLATENDERVGVYEKMYMELLKIYLHLKLITVYEKATDRQEKAQGSLEVLDTICTKFLEFLKSERTVDEMGSFVANMRHDLMVNEPNFLDRHKKVSVKKVFCLPTETRNLMQEYLKYCDQLTYPSPIMEARSEL